MQFMARKTAGVAAEPGPDLKMLNYARIRRQMPCPECGENRPCVIIGQKNMGHFIALQFEVRCPTDGKRKVSMSEKDGQAEWDAQGNDDYNADDRIIAAQRRVDALADARTDRKRIELAHYCLRLADECRTAGYLDRAVDALTERTSILAAIAVRDPTQIGAWEEAVADCCDWVDEDVESEMIADFTKAAGSLEARQTAAAAKIMIEGALLARQSANSDETAKELVESGLAMFRALPLSERAKHPYTAMEGCDCRCWFASTDSNVGPEYLKAVIEEGRKARQDGAPLTVEAMSTALTAYADLFAARQDSKILTDMETDADIWDNDAFYLASCKIIRAGVDAEKSPDKAVEELTEAIAQLEGCDWIPDAATLLAEAYLDRGIAAKDRNDKITALTMVRAAHSNNWLSDGSYDDSLSDIAAALDQKDELQEELAAEIAEYAPVEEKPEPAEEKPAKKFVAKKTPAKPGKDPIKAPVNKAAKKKAEESAPAKKATVKLIVKKAVPAKVPAKKPIKAAPAKKATARESVKKEVPVKKASKPVIKAAAKAAPAKKAAVKAASAKNVTAKPSTKKVAPAVKTSVNKKVVKAVPKKTAKPIKTVSATKNKTAKKA